MACLNKKIIITAVAIAGSGLFVQYLSHNYILGFNTTGSLPDRLYLVNKNEKSFNLGDKVAFLYDSPEYFIYKKGKLFAKIATCFPGQELIRKRNIFYCDGKQVAVSFEKDSKGQNLPVFIYNGRIPQGNYFFTTPHLNSYDSRYFGFVKKEQIIGVARSVF